MSINGIGNSAASWAQFVKVSQAARERNGIQAGNGGAAEAQGVRQNVPHGIPQGGTSNASAAQEANVVSFKKAFDVYSSKLTAPVQSVQPLAPVNEINRKTVGGRFDAYA